MSSTLQFQSAEWALVAKQVLTLPLTAERDNDEDDEDASFGVIDCAAPFRPDATVLKRNAARTFFNLMLTCRELYHDLPWAMPKWCLAHTFHVGRGVGIIPVTDWLDTFQATLTPAPAPSPSRLSQPAQLHTTAQGNTVGTHIRARPSAPTSSPELMWMENRLLVYCWLGVTWDSSCTFLRERLPRLQGGCTRQDFWEQFAQYGSIRFLQLADIETWAIDATTLQTQPHHAHGQAEQDDAADQPQPQEPQKDHLQEVPHAPDMAGSSARTGDDGTGCAVLPMPALFYLDATLHSQADAQRFHELRTTVLAHARGGSLRLCVASPWSSLSAYNMNAISITSADAGIDQLCLRDVGRVEWTDAESQRSVRGELERVGRFDIHHWNAVDDVSVLSGVSAVRLSYNEHQTRDLTPLRGVKKLILREPPSGTGQEVIAAAQHLQLSDMVLEVNTLTAKRIRLSEMISVPDVLHLPNATHIELLRGCAVKQFTCPPRINALAIHRCDFISMPNFEHADVVTLWTPLTREQLTDLGNRVDRLELHYCVEDMAPLRDIRHDAYVCLTNAVVDSRVPPCVKELHAFIFGGVQCAFLRTVPMLSMTGGLEDRIHDVHLLSGRAYLNIEQGCVDGEIADCDHVHLHHCYGTARLTSINTLSITCATLAPPPTASNTDDTIDDHIACFAGGPKLQIRCLLHVANCRLHNCEINTFTCFRNVQRVALRRCRFDCLDSIPPFTSLKLHNCTTTDRAWQWPDITVVGRPPQEVQALLLAGRTERRAMWKGANPSELSTILKREMRTTAATARACGLAPLFFQHSSMDTTTAGEEHKQEHDDTRLGIVKLKN
ncbi:hypothetical protein PTSG_11156 [Salpingoeca rosetta]|uniref:Uncharacterized protein n=1 Tax=Salpingoeca rosetta (strain ATCC 50818 / BSB-021) TaxID=946362 RepID=F2USL0_SALR5|nr:uncharacterized protein PTSG_11156 [Salpingoeca rosetta]EGD81119.1 hypothetical protein PTSG_11156 [Salpingoeca rosetta]|eukprot:XP_004987804.1 hypothetical protein PTSG_11156 [Salpingoeca rosetta]